jgi:hypothetical protein
MINGIRQNIGWQSKQLLWSTTELATGGWCGAGARGPHTWRRAVPALSVRPYVPIHRPD